MLTVNLQPPAQSHSDEALLQSFADSGSQDAFGALVRKYLGMVLGVAIRRTGDRAMAEEIAQNVFTILARKARGLKCGATLAGWIHRVTAIECADALRRKLSHQTKMNTVSQHLLSELDGREVWREAMPLLDDGIDALTSAEREIVLLRFFEGKSFREIGTALGKTDDAAQKQTERALQKLSAYLKRKGVTVPVAVLSAGLATHLVQAAPSALAHSIAHGALTTASTFNAKILILETLHAMTNTKLKTAIVAAAVLAVPLVLQWTENSRLRAALDLAQHERNTFTAGAHAIQSATPDDFASSMVSSADSRIGLPSSLGAASSVSSAPTNTQDPAALTQAWEHALFIADPLERSQRLAELLAGLTAENAPHIAAAFEHAKDSGIRFGDERRLFLRAWGKLGGAPAVEYAIKHAGNASDEAMAALGGWATAAPHLAQAWLEALPNSDTKEKLVYGLLDGWSTRDFQAAAAYAESRPASPARDRFRELLLQRALRAGGLSAAQNWIARIPGDEQNRAYKQGAFSGVVQAMLYRDPAAAAQWIASLDGESYVGADAVTKTAAKLAETSPTEALRWMASLKPADLKGVSRGAGSILQQWAQQDAPAAGTWLQSNPTHPFYDQLASSYVQSVVASDPSAAKAWAQTIREPVTREKALASLSQPQLEFFGTINYGVSLDKVGSTNGESNGIMLLAADTAEGASKSSLTLTQNVGDKFEFATNQLSWKRGASGAPYLETAEFRKASPHDSGPQWKNCATCHAK
jgi:RNA polymerase sigma factor (sigma-70 family)